MKVKELMMALRNFKPDDEIKVYNKVSECYQPVINLMSAKQVLEGIKFYQQYPEELNEELAELMCDEEIEHPHTPLIIV